MAESTEPDYLDAAGVAKRLGVRRATIWRYIQSGRIKPDGRIFGHPVWQHATVDAYLERMAYDVRLARQYGDDGTLSGHAPDNCRACRYVVIFNRCEATGVDWRRNVPVDATVSGETVYLGSGMAVVRGPDGKWSVLTPDAAAAAFSQGSAGRGVAGADALATGPTSGQEGASQ